MKRTDREKQARDVERLYKLTELNQEMYGITGDSDLTHTDYIHLEVLIEKAFSQGEMFGYDDGWADAPDGW
jgi:hypothetical protein